MNRALAIILAPTALLLCESIAFIAHPFTLPSTFTDLFFPAVWQLKVYCAASSCIYPSDQVASLYSVQFATFILICAAIGVVSLKKGPSVADQTLRLICALILAGTVTDYARGNFSFRPIWIFPNSIVYSPLGLFRYVLSFGLAAVALLLMSNVISPKETKHGRLG